MNNTVKNEHVRSLVKYIEECTRVLEMKATMSSITELETKTWSVINLENIVDITRMLVDRLATYYNGDDNVRKMLIIDALNLFIQKYPPGDPSLVRVINLMLPTVIDTIFKLNAQNVCMDSLTTCCRRSQF